MTVLDKLFALAVAATYNFGDHSLAYQSLLNHYPNRSRVESEFRSYANSFLFQLSYNLDIAVVQQRFIEEIVRSNRISRNRRTNVAELEAPRRRYIADLVYHYQMGVASDNPSLEYLSYYHVSEHFFESIFNDDLLEEVKDMITHPDFSYQRKGDLRKLVRDVTKRVQLRNETIVFNEVEALKLTLERVMN